MIGNYLFGNVVSMKSSTTNFLSSLTDLVYPDTCVVCGLNLKGDGLVSEGICQSCVEKLTPTNLGNWQSGVRHGDGLDVVCSGWWFSSDIQQVIHSLKYQERAKFGAVLGRYLATLIPADTFGSVDALIPIPLHSAKYRHRGFNQAEWIARGLSIVWDIPVRTKWLSRIRNTQSQTKLTSTEREENMKHAFRGHQQVAGKNLVLVDDVLTTGATMSACARALKHVGAATVSGITCSTPLRPRDELLSDSESSHRQNKE